MLLVYKTIPKPLLEKLKILVSIQYIAIPLYALGYPPYLHGWDPNNWRNTMSNIKNIKKSISNTFGAVTQVVSVSTELLADTSLFISNSIGATPNVLKSMTQTPFTAARGYIMESEGISKEDAHKRAFKYIDQDVATTIVELSEGSGKLLADLFKEEADPITTSEKKEVINQ